MAFLPNTSIDKAMEIAENIRHRLEQLNYEKDNTKFSLTVSIGLAMLKEKDTPEILLKRADAALYVSKNSGRNVGIIET